MYVCALCICAFLTEDVKLRLNQYIISHLADTFIRSDLQWVYTFSIWWPQHKYTSISLQYSVKKIQIELAPLEDGLYAILICWHHAFACDFIPFICCIYKQQKKASCFDIYYIIFNSRFSGEITQYHWSWTEMNA